MTVDGARNGRAGALAVIAFAAILAGATSRIDYAFSSDPLGPRAFPYMIAAALGACGIWYLLRPGVSEPWPDRATFGRGAFLVALTALAVGAMDLIGFPAAALAMAGATAWLFGARPALALGIGLVQAVFWFVLFRHLLGTYLPAGFLPLGG